MTERIGFDIKPNGDVILSLGNLATITIPYEQLQSIAKNAQNLKNAYEQFQSQLDQENSS